jgi:hypothetical protein
MHPFHVPRRLRLAGAFALATAATAIALAGGSVSTTHAAADSTNVPLCVLHPQLCTEAGNPWVWNNYTYNSGHDEPSLLFYSDTPGSGNSNRYQLTLPTDAATPPAQDGSGGTWNFMLHPAFWFGMAMCDDQSAPDPGKACPADSDRNIYTSTDPHSARYLGLTPGTAFMEMQFYPPGWGGVGTGVSCGPDNNQWCAALNIDSFSQNSNTGVLNNSSCLNAAGEEYVNYAIITKSGQSQGPADPLRQTLATFTTGPDTLEMNSGDRLTVDMHDTPAGFQVVIHDLTTGETGSMTASIANGFGHPLFQPGASTCTDQPYAFHPMYSTSGPNTRVLWAAHSYNVAFSDEIGHFEYCNALNSVQGSSCKASSFPDATDATKDGDDRPCYDLGVVDPAGVTVVPSFIGCLGSDSDFDGPEYQAGAWPGSPGADPSKVSAPITFSSPLFTGPGNSGLQNYDQVAFETDLPRIEGADSSPNNNCQRHVTNPADPAPGSGCVDPPVGSTFYPIFTTNTGSDGSCIWQEGGAGIPGTTNDFGGTSTAEYGGLLLSNYPAAGFTITQRYNNFHNTLAYNPCPAPGGTG